MTASVEILRARNAAAQRRSRARNPQKHKAKVEAWRAANQEKVKAAGRAWRAANVEKRLAYKISSRVRSMAYQADYHAKNKDAINAARRAKYADNPRKYEHFTARNNLRRAKRRAAGGTHTAGDIETLLVLQRGKCATCREKVKGRFQVDHIMPLKLGGSNGKENLQILCPQCNKSKHAKHPIDFMQQRGFLL